MSYKFVIFHNTSGFFHQQLTSILYHNYQKKIKIHAHKRKIDVTFRPPFVFFFILFQFHYLNGWAEETNLVTKTEREK